MVRGYCFDGDLTESGHIKMDIHIAVAENKNG